MVCGNLKFEIGNLGLGNFVGSFVDVRNLKLEIRNLGLGNFAASFVGSFVGAVGRA
jgi:hypothetical protein